MKVNPAPAVTGWVSTTLNDSCPAGPGTMVRFTVVDSESTASEAVSVCAPARIRVAEKVPEPLASAESGGRTTP